MEEKPFELKVEQIGQFCRFELSWAKKQRLTARLNYPTDLITTYQQWQRVYLNFYTTLSASSRSDEVSDSLRGRVANQGSITPSSQNWHRRLVEAETKLLYEFHYWLRSAELYEMRAQISQASQAKPQPLDLFLTCTPLELARLPWETWEIGTEFATQGKIRFVRSPVNIRSSAGSRHKRRRKARILAILGDETGLNFQQDQEAVRSLSRLAEIHVIGWQPGKAIEELKSEISQAIADWRGWDILFFAGHSNETALTGGELGIAPGASIALKEITPQLKIAQQQGLQFALFNSCSGLNLAETLIDLGFSQVAVMREPIHNRVAQTFLVQFLQHLATYQDVHNALISACEFLRLKQNLTLPSAYLIPSLFRHPDGKLFHLEPADWKQWLTPWLPNPWEAAAITALCLTCWHFPLQDWLLEKRILIQAIYRHLTQQVSPSSPFFPSSPSSSPLLLVQIDDRSINLGKVSSTEPLSRQYLAQLIERAVNLDFSVVGLDYLLDRSQENDFRLARTLENAIEPNQTLFIFAGKFKRGSGWLKANEEIVKTADIWHGDLRLLGSNGQYLRLLPNQKEIKPDSEPLLPLGYLFALAYRLKIESTTPPKQPLFQQNPLDLVPHLHSQRMQVQPLTTFSYQLRQVWLRPIVDFSLPPQQIYQSIPAWEFLNLDPNQRQQNYPQPLVIIVPGDYSEAGIDNSDRFLLPSATRYWRERQTDPDLRPTMSGGEIHAYVFHHYLNQWLVIPIPPLWLMGLAVVLGKGMAIALPTYPQRRWRWLAVLVVAITGYGVVSLQLYLSAAVILPWLLPTLTVGVYLVPFIFRKKAHG